MDMRLKKFKDAEIVMGLFNQLHLHIPNLIAVIINYEVYVLDGVHQVPLKKWANDGYWNSFLDSVRKEGERYKVLKNYL